MNLHFKLPAPLRQAAALADGEEIAYCVPYDLDGESHMGQAGFLAVTRSRLLLFDRQGLSESLPLSSCEDIKCESLVDNGILTVKTGGIWRILCRFSMRHVSRFAYVVRGVKVFLRGEDHLVESLEHEKLCPKCGRALPGTRECPHCDGKGDTFRKFLRLCKPYWVQLLLISLFMVASSFLNLLGPEVQKRFIDGVLAPKTGSTADVLQFIGVILLITGLLIATSVIRNWWCTALGARISMDLRAKLYQKVQALSLTFLHGRKPGDLMNRIVWDTAEIRQFMQDTFGNMLSTLITMLGALLYMFAANWKLGLLSLVFLPIVMLLSFLWRKKIHRMFRNQRHKSDKLNSSLQDVLSGMRVVKSFGKEKDEAGRFNDLAVDFARVQRRNEVFWASFYPLLTFIMGMGIYFVTYFGGLDVLGGGGMTVGGLTQFIAYAGILYGPLGWMTMLPRRLMRMITGLERVYDILDEQPDIVDKENARAVDIRGDVEFKDVTFGYKSYEPVLENISFSVKRGEMIGLVGPSGAGKSTLINLLMRLYDVDDGAITIDGADIRDISLHSLHSQIGVVLQETFLFSGTILNNIRFARPEATLEEVIRAAKMANAHDFICRMPDGYNTYVGEKGHNLSGGERQRVAIARAILGNPKLLILDEATSSLDTESEYQIQQALDRLTEGRTTFAIAHRLSTLRNADRLLVIDRHGLAESGTHNELLEKKGIYYGLVTAQLQMHAVPGIAGEAEDMPAGL